MLHLRLSSAGPSKGDRDRSDDRRVVAYDRDGSPSAYGSRRGDEIRVAVPDVATFHLSAGEEVVRAVAEGPSDDEAVLDAYYGTALPLVVQATRELEVLHGGAVLLRNRGRVFAFCGVSGSGKSTISYGLAVRGHTHWADDAVAVRVDRSGAAAVGLPFTVKLREPAASHFSAAASPLRVIEELQWREAPLGAVFLLAPEPGAGAPADTQRLVPAEALRTLLPNAFRFLPAAPERRRVTMRTYLDLVAAVPVLRLSYRRDFDRLPALLDEIERWMGELE